MALNKDTLGLARYNAMMAFNNKTEAELITEHGTIEAARLAAIKADSDEIIKHFIANARTSVPGTGLIAGPYAVTGSSTTGTIS